MENEKKPKNGFDRLKIKYTKLKAEKEDLQAKLTELENKVKAAAEDHNKDIREKESDLSKQSAKIQGYEEDLANAQSAAREYRRQAEEAIRRMGWLRRLWYGYNIPKFSDDDQWND